MKALQAIQSKIHEIRGHKVMLDFDLADLYQTETKRLKQAVKRNISRFPADFMFELTEAEYENLRSQIVTSGFSWGGSRYRPFVFTEQGVAMLSSVLKTRRAIQMNIAIMRAFVVTRQYALSHKELTEKLRDLEIRYDKRFKDIHAAITYLITKDKKEMTQNSALSLPKWTRRRIGFKQRRARVKMA